MYGKTFSSTLSTPFKRRLFTAHLEEVARFIASKRGAAGDRSGCATKPTRVVVLDNRTDEPPTA